MVKHSGRSKVFVLCPQFFCGNLMEKEVEKPGSTFYGKKNILNSNKIPGLFFFFMRQYCLWDMTSLSLSLTFCLNALS